MAAVRCPECAHVPRGAAWRCDVCHEAYDAVAALGACPECAVAWVDVACPACGAWSPLEAWQAEPGARAQVAARLDEAERSLGDASHAPELPSLERARGEVLRLLGDVAAAATTARRPGALAEARRDLEAARTQAVTISRGLERLVRHAQRAPGGAPWRPIVAQPEAWGAGLGALARRAGLEHRQALAALEALGTTADAWRRKALHHAEDLWEQGAGERGARFAGPITRARLDACDRALAVDPARHEAWRNRAWVRVSLGDLCGALADAEHLLRLGTSPPGEAERLRAEVRRVRGDLDGAERDARDAIEAAPDVPGNHLALACTLEERDDVDGCLAALERVVALEPTGSRGWKLRSFVEPTALRRLSALDEALQRRSESATLWALRGLHHLDEGEVERARLDVERAVRLRPHRAYARLAQAHVADASGAAADVRAALNRSLRLAPRWGHAWCQRGLLLLGDGSFALARSDLDAAVRCDPDSAQPALIRGLVRLATADLAGAREDLEVAAQRRGSRAALARLWLAARFGASQWLDGPLRDAWHRELAAHLRAGSDDLQPLLDAADRLEAPSIATRTWRRAQLFALAAARADARGDSAAGEAHAERALAGCGTPVPLLVREAAWARARLLVAHGQPIVVLRGPGPTVPPQLLPGDTRAPVAAPSAAGEPLAAASPPAPCAAAPSPAPAATSIVDQLERLVALHRAGVLTDAELAAAKRKVLGLG